MLMNRAFEARLLAVLPPSDTWITQREWCAKAKMGRDNFIDALWTLEKLDLIDTTRVGWHRPGRKLLLYRRKGAA